MPKVEKIHDARDWLLPLRITLRKAHRVSSQREKSPRKLVKCGCCERSVEIYFDEEPTGDTSVDVLEINRVHGTVDQWRKVLLPLLGIKP